MSTSTPPSLSVTLLADHPRSARSSFAAESIYSHHSADSANDLTSISSIDDDDDNQNNQLRQQPAISRPLYPGVYVPTLAFFHADSEDLDLPTIATHAVRLARAGVAGITTQGSNGEALHLTHSERIQVTRTTRHALDGAGYPHMPIIVGCGVESTREAIELCRDAATSGGDYALILPPSYFRAMFTSRTIQEFYHDIADASPIPILIYNYPAAVSGVDLSSDAIISLAKHPNIVGCKLTCGNTGKLARIAAATNAVTPLSPLIPQDRSMPSFTAEAQSEFMCLGGSADFTLQTLITGGSGVLCGLANIAPRACVRIIDLYTTGRLAEAQKLQAIVARGDWAAISTGLVGTKSALDTYFGYGGHARRPLPRLDRDEVDRIAGLFREIVDLERHLESSSLSCSS